MTPYPMVVLPRCLISHAVSTRLHHDQVAAGLASSRWLCNAMLHVM
jgi:hypothetical protein